MTRVETAAAPVVKKGINLALQGGGLDHYHDVEIDFANCKAIVRNSRTVELRFCVATRLVALAFLPPTRQTAQSSKR
jgi:hypothetical protein